MCSFGFAKLAGKIGNWHLYALGANGRTYGQAMAYISLYTERLQGISMNELWGRISASPAGTVTAINRFKLLERLERGDARINELVELMESSRSSARETTKFQINGLKKMGLIEYVFSEEDLLLLLSGDELKSGKFRGLPKKIAENDMDGLTPQEFGRLRLRMTSAAKEKLGRLMVTARSIVKTGYADPKIMSLARRCAADQSLGLIAGTPLSNYLKSHYMRTYTATPNFRATPMLQPTAQSRQSLRAA